MHETKPLSYCIFDGLQWNSKRGLGRYAAQLGKHLAQMSWQRRIYAQPKWNSNVGRVLLCELVEPIWREVLRPDLAFYPHNVLPFTFVTHSSLRILVLHDVLFLDSENLNAGNRYRSLKLKGSLSRADLIITVSETSRSEVLQRLKPRCPVLVIPNALAEGFDIALEKRKSREMSLARILHFGGYSPTKNTRNVLRAVALLRQKGFDVHVDLAAMSGVQDIAEQWRQEAELPSHALTVLPSLSDVQLRDVYACADVHCMPSTGEGFGIPVIEAARTSTPNVLSPLPVFRELIGDDAIFSASFSAEAIADSLVKCLSSDTRAMTHRAMRGTDRFVFDSIHEINAVPVLQAIEAMVELRDRSGN